jgi:hypothetical protein
VPEEGEDELLTPATPGEADGGEKDGDWKPDISVKVTKAKGKVGAKKKGAAGAAGEKSGPKARAKPKGGAKSKVDPGAAGGAGGAEEGKRTALPRVERVARARRASTTRSCSSRSSLP